MKRNTRNDFRYDLDEIRITFLKIIIVYSLVMMADLKINFMWIRMCFIFALFSHYKCDKGLETGPTPLPSNVTTEISCCVAPSTPLICHVLFVAFLLISIFALLCAVYFLYLKRLEVKSKICSCRMQKVNQMENQTNEPRYSLDPVTIAKLFAHHNITVNQRNDYNNQTNTPENPPIKPALNKSHSDLDKKILTWNAHKYLEYLKNEDNHIYECADLAVPQRKNLNTNNGLGTSGTQNSLIQDLFSFKMDDSVKKSPKIFHEKKYNDRF